jgi:hypothetical protein
MKAKLFFRPVFLLLLISFAILGMSLNRNTVNASISFSNKTGDEHFAFTLLKAPSPFMSIDGESRINSRL